MNTILDIIKIINAKNDIINKINAININVKACL